MTSLRREAIQEYGGRCACCGEKDWRFLTLDHVRNDGAAHRRAISGAKRGQKFYQALKRRGWPDKERLRVLCFNCNISRQNSPMKRCAHEDPL